MENNFNEVLFDKMMIESKIEIKGQLYKIKETKELSYYGKCLLDVCFMQNSDLKINYNLIIQNKSELSSNIRNAIRQFFDIVIAKYYKGIKENK